MAKPKFVQIAVGATADYQGSAYRYAALDENGVVWWYDADDQKWRPLSSARHAA